MLERPTFVTGSADKLGQYTKYMATPISHENIDLAEIQSLNLRKVVEQKAREGFARLGRPVVVEDIALRFHALGRLPGTFIKHFISEAKPDVLCRMLDSFPDRSATAEINVAYYDGEAITMFVASSEGRISDAPAGENGFGWDAIFIPDGYDITRAQMTSEQQDETSIRRVAVEKLKNFLQEKNETT